MPEAKRISDLPEISQVEPDAILPVVNPGLTATYKCTASQISILGGGPPGNNTVSTDSLRNGAVTGPKTGYDAAERIIVCKSNASQENGKYLGEEVVCTNYAQGIFGASNAADARLYLGALQSSDNPTFTGQVQIASGTPGAPALAHTGDTNTGLYFGTDTVALATNGLPRFAIDHNGAAFFTLEGEGTLREAGFVRAMATFDSVGGMFPDYLFGVQSITKIGTGIFRINFEKDFPDTDYATAANCNESVSPGAAAINANGLPIAANVMWIGDKAVDGVGVQLRQWDWNNGSPRWIYADATQISVIIFR